jgi:uncharacterized OB-fold protein
MPQTEVSARDEPNPRTDHLPGPVVNADSATYWAGVAKGILMIRRCRSCELLHFMPRHLCPHCWSDNLEWIESSGCGHVHSFTIVRRAPIAVFNSQVPYVLALIDLAEGPRMMANIRGPDASNLRIGDAVRVIFEDRAFGTKLPQFIKVPSAST